MPVATDILRAYIEPRRSARRVLSQINTEGKALALMLVGCILLFCSQLPDLVVSSRIQGNQLPLAGMAAARLIGTLILAPLLFYAIAGFSGLVMRSAGYSVDWRQARVSLFWAILAVSPAALISEFVRGFVGDSGVLQLTPWIIMILFLVFWTSGIIESAGIGAMKAGNSQ